MLVASGAAFGAGDAQGWITHPEARATPVVLHFRRELELTDIPATLPVTITADNRFILYVNGKPVARGPSTGTIQRWRTSAVDLAPHLSPGRNVIAATVWNFGAVAPAHQQSVATGFRVTGARLATSQPGWRVRIDAGHGAGDGKKHIPWTYYVASAPEIIDAAKATWDRDVPEVADDGWVEAVPAPAAAVRTLIADPLPSQSYSVADAGVVVRSSRAGIDGFPAVPVTIPANTVAKLLIRRDAMISAYPELDVDGGRDARIELQYGEALYDAKNQKADRDLVGDRQLRGFHDTFIADGRARTFAPLWWRTFRFVEIAVTTKAQPLTLRALRLHETGYPFEPVASFRSSDPDLDRIWDIGWRTLRIDAHETFMDSSYWEQLQYTGDTRLQMLITYAVSGDARLARQAIDVFAESDIDGVQQGAYPSRLDNVIATFSFAWIGMLADWQQEQPDRELPTRHLPRMRRVLAYFEPFLNARGLVGKNPHWNFIDWSGQRWDDRDSFPSWGKDNGSCLMTAMWLGALRQGGVLEADFGDRARAAEYTTKAAKAREAIREHCWDESRGLYADDPDKQVFSQHMNVFAVLYDVATREEASAILDRVVKPGAGIDAPDGMYAPTYYFAWYLVRAFEHAGRADRYLDLLKTWRDLLALNYTTWPESRGETRSDTHAWSAHPTADLLGLVAGIRPGAPGYARVRIEPNLGSLEWLDATAATPRGAVRVRYRVTDGMLNADIERPAGLAGDFHWRGKVYPLTRPRMLFTLPAR